MGKKLLLALIFVANHGFACAQFMGYETPVEMPSMGVYNNNSFSPDLLHSAANGNYSTFVYAVKFYEDGKYTSAINALNINISTVLATSSDYYLRARCYEALKEYKQAKKDYRKAWYKGFGGDAYDGYYRMRSMLKDIHAREKKIAKSAKKQII